MATNVNVRRTGRLTLALRITLLAMGAVAWATSARAASWRSRHCS